MEYREIKPLHESVSLLGFGIMRMPKNGPREEDIDFEASKAMLDAALDAGVNYLDTAYIYHGGASEPFLGKALAGRPRESYKLATKLPVFLVKTRADAERIFNEQLARLQTTYIDFYLLHALGEEVRETVDSLDLHGFFTQKKAEGKIRHLGFSFHGGPECLDAYCGAYDWDFAQIQLNYLDWELYKSKEQYEILKRHGLPTVIMEPVRGGMLASVGPKAAAVLSAARPGKSPASWAIRYAASFPEVMTVLSGMSTMPQLEDNLATMQPFEPLTSTDRHTLKAALAAMKETAAIPCTACRYCMPCPQGVSIPDIFWVYNDAARNGGAAVFEAAYRWVDDSEKPQNCTECGACTSICPQQLPIPQLLRRVDKREDFSDLLAR